jgi:hypothetical protein
MESFVKRRLSEPKFNLILNLDVINKESLIIKNMTRTSSPLLEQCNPTNLKTILILKQIDEMFNFDEPYCNYFTTIPYIERKITNEEIINNKVIMQNNQRQFIETVDFN